jgi:hypothetical protein
MDPDEDNDREAADSCERHRWHNTSCFCRLRFNRSLSVENLVSTIAAMLRKDFIPPQAAKAIVRQPVRKQKSPT